MDVWRPVGDVVCDGVKNERHSDRGGSAERGYGHRLHAEK